MNGKTCAKFCPQKLNDLVCISILCFNKSILAENSRLEVNKKHFYPFFLLKHKTRIPNDEDNVNQDHPYKIEKIGLSKEKKL